MTGASIVVREAVPGDAPAIRDVALDAWRATYRGRISDDAIERFLARAYTEERVALRIARHVVLVAGRWTGPAPAPVAVEAFAECAVHHDHVQLVAIYALPAERGRGLGSALVAAVLDRFPGRDLAADVLAGNELAEPFYAALGFEPGEGLTEEIGGEPIRERRWWLRGRG